MSWLGLIVFFFFFFSRETKRESSSAIPGPPTSGRYILWVLLQRKTTKTKKCKRKASEVSLVNFGWRHRVPKKGRGCWILKCSSSFLWACPGGGDSCGRIDFPDDRRAGLQLSVDTNRRQRRDKILVFIVSFQRPRWLKKVV